MRIQIRRLLEAAVVMMALLLPQFGQAAVPRIPGVDLGRTIRGEAALAALGRDLPAVARAYGLTTSELERRFRDDRHMAADRDGRLFYEDDFGFPGEAGAEVPGTALASSYPMEDTFRLHSRPGAKRVIFLDFDGHVISGTAWNANYNGGADITAPPYDFEGGPASFTTNELTRIQQIWQRVSEDFVPFDVDVTTEYMGEAAITRTGSSDEFYGMRVLISPISSYFGRYGGIAYVGAFDDLSDYFKPALIFPEWLSQAEKNIGEASSHETGHTLGLGHDGTTTGMEYYSGHGTGETGWAPIMGNGYSKNLTEWSKGEYASANNKQDDLALIAGYLSYRPDDCGNAIASATHLPAGSTIDAVGAIGGGTDADVFAIAAGAGVVSLQIVPAAPGPNLDVVAELFDGSGALLASSDSTDLLGADISIALPADTYFLRLGGTGAGDPLGTGYTSYASMGQYRVSGTVVDPTGHVPPYAVATATPSQGTAPLTVQFDGSGSSDPDGSIVYHHWEFGDGGGSGGATTAHVYTTPGDYTATLTVTDDSGFSDSTTVAIDVLAANQPPTAVALASPSSGVAPLAVLFSGSGSSDPDGTVVAWQWNFGDGTSGSGATASHTYAATGAYTATLTVADDRGATASATVVVSVQQAQMEVVRVASIQMAVVPVAGGQIARATVRVTDLAGTAVAGATVSGAWSGAVTGTSFGTTDTSGSVVLSSKKSKRGGTFTFTVTNVTKANYVYDPSKNVVSTASIAVAPGPFGR